MPTLQTNRHKSANEGVLETFVGSKKTLIWIGTAVDHFRAGILGWVLGDHSAKTFAPLWAIVAAWQCYFIVTNGWSVYPGFILEGEKKIKKTYMTRVEGENTRLRHYERTIASQDLVLFQIEGNVGTLNSIVAALSQVSRGSCSTPIHTAVLSWVKHSNSNV